MIKNKVQFGGITSLVMGSISSICCFISRTSFGSPLNMMHKLNDVNIMPPLWILNLLSFLFYFLIGFSAGLVIEAGACKMNLGDSQAHAYRGGIGIVASFFLSLIRYHVFFLSEKIFISLLISIISTICIFLCTYEWSKIIPSKASITVGLCGFFELYLTIIILISFFNL